jgi:hypothetical protein
LPLLEPLPFSPPSPSFAVVLRKNKKTYSNICHRANYIHLIMYVCVYAACDGINSPYSPRTLTISSHYYKEPIKLPCQCTMALIGIYNQSFHCTGLTEIAIRMAPQASVLHFFLLLHFTERKEEAWRLKRGQTKQ